MKTVIFTGAGAASADGLPIQADLFRAFFAQPNASPGRTALVDSVRAFFQDVFDVDPKGDATSPLPTFEEALGVLELALTRDEGVRQGPAADPGYSLIQTRRQLILALAATVARGVSSAAPTLHSRLVESLRKAGILNDVTFVTTNYDTLIDDAIELEGIAGERGTGSPVDYGLDGLIEAPEGPFTEKRRFPCYKIHGSLNWLYCGACDLLTITYSSEGVTRLVDEPKAARCPSCETPRTPVIVPPSYYKSMSRIYLATVWSKAFQALRRADHVVFCGYSFPDADMHVKYLVKRAQLNRDPNTDPVRFTLVNHFPGKEGAVATGEALRFGRFLGAGSVVDSRLSFAQFAADPEAVLGGGGT